jgi:hypothetical protein
VNGEIVEPLSNPQALHKLNSAIKASPADGSLYYLRGQLYELRFKSYKKAAEDYATAAKYGSRFARLHQSKLQALRKTSTSPGKTR